MTVTNMTTSKASIAEVVYNLRTWYSPDNTGPNAYTENQFPRPKVRHEPPRHDATRHQSVTDSRTEIESKSKSKNDVS